MGVLEERTQNGGVEYNKIQRIVHVVGIAVVNLSAFADSQIAGVSREIYVCDTEAAGTGAHVNEFDLLVPVGKKTDIFIVGVPYHKI